jgi:hypothetical protein
MQKFDAASETDDTLIRIDDFDEFDDDEFDDARGCARRRGDSDVIGKTREGVT